ncbi:MAG: hypothetical protein Q8P57_00730 [Candidatus Pacearchaeota archaeon]|nr:hypothetical protein [Candidatus Pacearchaeota archaeon]
MVKYEFDILIGSIMGITVILIILATIIKKFFSENKISRFLEKIAEWVSDNVRI